MLDLFASSSPGRKLRKWRQLTDRERLQLVQLGFLLSFVWLGLRIFGFNRARRWAEFALPATPTPLSVEEIKRAEQCARLTGITARSGLYHANCLHQSLALCRMLRSNGLPALICIGVRPCTSPFQAHAWVELEKVPVGQTVNEYSAFKSLTTSNKTKSTS